MAKLDLSLNVPDAHVARIQTALRAYFGKVPNGTENGGVRELTNPELIDRLRGIMIAKLKDIVRGQERSALVAASPIDDIDAT